MTERTNPAGDLDDAETFDVDAWIDDVVRPEKTVLLYPYETDYAARVAAIEAQIPAAEKNTDRGMDDPSPETLWAQLAELKAEREAKALKVRVRQITDGELAAALVAAKKAKAEESDAPLWALAAACVEPNFTPDQLRRLRDRDRSGESMVSQLVAAVNDLLRGLPVPSSPER